MNAEARAQEEAKIAEKINSLQTQLDNATKGMVQQQNVARILKQRLVVSESKRIALMVVHGDLPPENYEARRRAAESAVDQLVKTVLEGPISG